MGTRNTLADLNNHLFEQLERLNDEELSGEDFEREVKRSKALQNIGKTIIDNGRLVLDAEKFSDDRLDASSPKPRMLEG